MKKLVKVAGEEKPGHRGVGAGTALHSLHKEQLKKNALKASEKPSGVPQFSLLKDRGSQRMRMTVFKKEFKMKLTEHLKLKGEAEPKDHGLTFQHVALIMHDMGFLQAKVSQEQEQLVEDIYSMFKTEKEQKVLAENL